MGLIALASLGFCAEFSHQAHAESALAKHAQMWGAVDSKIFPEAHLRAQVISGNTLSIVNRISWPLILDIVPDGAFLKKGERIALFDKASIETKLKEKRHDLKQVSNQLEQKLLSIDTGLQNLEDKLADQLASLDILLAKRERLLQYPLAEDVASAQGELDIAQLNLEASEKELEKNKRRYEKKMISLQQLDNSKSELKVEKIKLEMAQNILELVKLPTSERTLNINQLEIDNAKLEVAKTKRDLLKKREIAQIQKKNARRQTKLYERRVQDLVDELEHVEILAPQDGVVRYTPRLIRTLTEGGKPQKNMALVEMPDMDTLQLKGLLPEYLGSYFKKGDLATPSSPQHQRWQKAMPTSQAELISISTNPIDLTELSKNWGDQGKSSGIKFFECRFKVPSSLSNVKLGTWVDLQLKANTAVTGWAIPITSIKTEEDLFYAKLNEQWQNIEGTPMGHLFFLSEQTLSQSPQSIEAKTASDGEPSFSNGQLSLMGELSPTQAVDVKIPTTRRYHHNLKTSWMAKEFSLVKEGDVILKLESENTDERIKNLQESLEKIKGELSSEQKEVELSKENLQHNEATLANRLSIAKLKLEITTEGIDAQAYYQAKRDLQLSKIELDKQKRKLLQAKAKPHLHSARSLRQQERQQSQSELKLELAQLKFDDIAKGPDELNIAQAQLQVDRLQNEWDKLMVQKNIDQRQFEKRIKRKEKQLFNEERRLRMYLEDKERFQIKAEASGILRYAKVWDGLSMSKLKTNISVWRSQRMMSITNNSSMQLKLEVPERYYPIIKKDMAVSIHIPAMDLENLPGKIETIHSVFKVKQRKQTEKIGLYTQQELLGYHVFEVVIVVDKFDMPFKTGALANVVFPFLITAP